MKKENQQAIKVGYGMAKDASSVSCGIKAARQAVLSIHVHAISAVLVFASVVYNLDEVLQGIHSVVGDVPVFGATTAGEICDTIYQGTVSVVVLASPYLRVHCGVGTNVSNDWRRALNEAIDSPKVWPFFYDSQYKERIRRQGSDYFVMLSAPGITRSTRYHGFEILEALKEKAGGEFLVMGGGATDVCLEENHVLFNQQAYSDSILLVVFETELQFGISLSHGFQPADKRAIVTAVEGDEVLTIDGVTAVDVYSWLIDIPKEEMTGIHPAHAHENGVTIGISDPMGQHSVNLVDSITSRGGIRLSRPVSEGTVLTRMNPIKASLVQAGAEGIRKAAIRGDITEIALCLLCYCSFRPKILGNLIEQEFAGMREVLAGKPLVGFCCCGEIGVADDGVSRFNTSSIACLVLGGQLSRNARITIKYNEVLEKMEVQSNILARTNKELLTEIVERKKIEAALRSEISEKAKLEAALRESEKKLKDFAQAVPDISVIIDEDGRYIEVFDSGYQLLKRPKEELNGYTLHQRFPAETAEAILRQIRQTISSGMSQCFIHKVAVGEEQRFFEGRTAPMSYLTDGKKTVAAVAIDVTERYKAERMIEFAYELRRKSDFINDIITGNIKVDEKASDTAQTFGLDFSRPLFCCLLTVNKPAHSTAEISSTTNNQILKNNIIELLSRDSGYLVWDCREGIGVLCQTRESDDAWGNSMQFAFRLQEKITCYDSDFTVRIGVSNMYSGTDSINKGYQQAWSAIVAMRCQREGNKVINHFRDIGIAQLLANMDGKKQVMEYIHEKLGKLIDYDRKKGTQLLLTLEEILQSNNLKESAGKMYVHYKTMFFRKQRIEKILGVSIDEYETKLALAAAVKLYKLSDDFDK
ncbi:MAG: carbohydrate diacid transcriptional activator CdaR [Firmicutes bacterium]|nr:carbohydrate diacid transcriptional activator CdaR [Bacillota bacterium]